MSSWALLLGVIPLVLFVIVDSLAGLKTALITAVVVALLEATFSYFYFGHIDWVSWTGLALIVALSFLSWKMQKGIFFKLQPTVLGILISFFLLGMYIFQQPFLFDIFMKYQALLPDQLLQLDRFDLYCNYLTLSLGVALLIHAIVVGYAAFKLNPWWWIFLRGVGIYCFIFMAALMATQLYRNELLSN